MSNEVSGDEVQTELVGVDGVVEETTSVLGIPVGDLPASVVAMTEEQLEQLERTGGLHVEGNVLDGDELDGGDLDGGDLDGDDLDGDELDGDELDGDDLEAASPRTAEEIAELEALVDGEIAAEGPPAGVADLVVALAVEAFTNESFDADAFWQVLEDNGWGELKPTVAVITGIGSSTPVGEEPVAMTSDELTAEQMNAALGELDALEDDDDEDDDLVRQLMLDEGELELCGDETAATEAP